MALLREWDALVAQLRAAAGARTRAALTLQRGARRLRADRIRRSRVTRRSIFFSSAAAAAGQGEEVNPFSSTYVGHAEHRRRVEAEMGRPLAAYGAPRRSAMERALPGQVSTLLNVLRLVDAVNELIRRRYVGVQSMAVPHASLARRHKGAKAAAMEGEEEAAVPWRSRAAAWQREAPAMRTRRPRHRRAPPPRYHCHRRSRPRRSLRSAAAAPLAPPPPPPRRAAGRPRRLRGAHVVARRRGGPPGRFSGAAILQVGKRFGLLWFDGELPRGGRVASRSSGVPRAGLLAPPRLPHLVVPALAKAKDGRARLAARLGDVP